MKCPHCQKEIDTNKGSPQALLAHIASMVRSKESRIEACKKHGDKSLRFIPRIQKSLDKWQAWAEWVEAQIEESKGAKT